MKISQGLFDAQTALITAGAAFFSGEQARLVEESATIAAMCQAAAAVCAELLLMTTADEATFERRETTLTAISAQYQACGAVIVDSRLKALQFNGVAIDLELVRFYLFGQEVVVASKL